MLEICFADRDRGDPQHHCVLAGLTAGPDTRLVLLQVIPFLSASPGDSPNRMLMAFAMSRNFDIV